MINGLIFSSVFSVCSVANPRQKRPVLGFCETNPVARAGRGKGECRVEMSHREHREGPRTGFSAFDGVP